MNQILFNWLWLSLQFKLWLLRHLYQFKIMRLSLSKYRIVFSLINSRLCAWFSLVRSALRSVGDSFYIVIQIVSLLNRYFESIYLLMCIQDMWLKLLFIYSNLSVFLCLFNNINRLSFKIWFWSFHHESVLTNWMIPLLFMHQFYICISFLLGVRVFQIDGLILLNICVSILYNRF